MSNNLGPINYDQDTLYGGPRSGDTPSDDSDLHTSGNPFNQPGSPEVNGTDDTGKGYRVGSNAPLGYFTNPPVSSTVNAYNQGAGEFAPGEQGCADSIASGYAAVYADVLSSRQPSAPDPGASGIYTDEGYGPIGTGRS